MIILNITTCYNLTPFTNDKQHSQKLCGAKHLRASSHLTTQKYVEAAQKHAERSKCADTTMVLVSVFCGIILWRHYKTSALSCASIDCLNNVYELLHILHCPVDFVVVTCSQVNHDMFITVEEHARAGVVQLVHFVKVWNLKRKKKLGLWVFFFF